jgi:hypothetical protein
MKFSPLLFLYTVILFFIENNDAIRIQGTYVIQSFSKNIQQLIQLITKLINNYIPISSTIVQLPEIAKIGVVYSTTQPNYIEDDLQPAFWTSIASATNTMNTTGKFCITAVAEPNALDKINKSEKAGIWVSNDSGYSWKRKNVFFQGIPITGGNQTEMQYLESRMYYKSVSMSSDGKYQIAVAPATRVGTRTVPGVIAVSRDYGNTWTIPSKMINRPITYDTRTDSNPDYDMMRGTAWNYVSVVETSPNSGLYACFVIQSTHLNLSNSNGYTLVMSSIMTKKADGTPDESSFGANWMPYINRVPSSGNDNVYRGYLKTIHVCPAPIQPRNILITNNMPPSLNPLMGSVVLYKDQDNTLTGNSANAGYVFSNVKTKWVKSMSLDIGRKCAGITDTDGIYYDVSNNGTKWTNATPNATLRSKNWTDMTFYIFTGFPRGYYATNKQGEIWVSNMLNNNYDNEGQKWNLVAKLAQPTPNAVAFNSISSSGSNVYVSEYGGYIYTVDTATPAVQ